MSQKNRTKHNGAEARAEASAGAKLPDEAAAAAPAAPEPAKRGPATPDERVAASAEERVAASVDERVAASVDERVASSAGERVAASVDERVAALEAERNEAKDRMLRVAAEFENWKKRARVTQAEAEAAARDRVLKDLLEIADNLERATDAHGAGAADAASVLKGVTLVLRLLQQKLERHDVRPFEAKGQPFDPRLHEAISRVESADVPAGAVAATLQKGYRIGEKLLRPAMVSVSTGPGGNAGAGAPGGEK